MSEAILFAGAPIIVPMPIRSGGGGTPMTLEIGLWMIYGAIAVLRGAFFAMESYYRGMNVPRSVVYGIAIGMIWPIYFVVGLVNGRRTK